jgi:hypothetical protein
MQEAANAADLGVSVSSFPYTEGPRKFGCNAGLLHLYISATGDVWPCDFIPLTFGNVLHEDIRDIYARMQAHVDTPRRRCWAKPVAHALGSRLLPLATEDSVEFCEGCDAAPRFGDFFRALQQSLKPVDSSCAGPSGVPEIGLASSAQER